MYKEGDKVYFRLGDVYEDPTWYKGVVHQPYKSLPVYSNGVYSIVGTNKRIHCFADESRLKPRNT